MPVWLLSQLGTGGRAKKPNIVVIWGDESAVEFGAIVRSDGLQNADIDRIAREGLMFTDYYADKAGRAGRASIRTGQAGLRIGLTKSACRAATLGQQARGHHIAEALKPHGNETDQIGKNQLGDRNELLRRCTASRVLRILHLNAEEAPSGEWFDAESMARVRSVGRGRAGGRQSAGDRAGIGDACVDAEKGARQRCLTAMKTNRARINLSNKDKVRMRPVRF